MDVGGGIYERWKERDGYNDREGKETKRKRLRWKRRKREVRNEWGKSEADVAENISLTGKKRLWNELHRLLPTYSEFGRRKENHVKVRQYSVQIRTRHLQNSNLACPGFTRQIWWQPRSCLAFVSGCNVETKGIPACILHTDNDIHSLDPALTSRYYGSHFEVRIEGRPA